jgi:hypothetical protein
MIETFKKCKDANLIIHLCLNARPDTIVICEMMDGGFGNDYIVDDFGVLTPEQYAEVVGVPSTTYSVKKYGLEKEKGLWMTLRRTSDRSIIVQAFVDLPRLLVRPTNGSKEEP